MPKENYMYGTPYEWYEKYGVRKYGFHGTSHQYVSEKLSNYWVRKTQRLLSYT